MADYNSSFTGAQIDAAISAVRTKESTWDGKAAASHNHGAGNITSGTLAIARGGTGATTAAAARTALGAAASSHNHGASEITSGTLAIARGGTGAATAAAARTALGAAAEAHAHEATEITGLSAAIASAIASAGACKLVSGSYTGNGNGGLRLINIGISVIPKLVYITKLYLAGSNLNLSRSGTIIKTEIASKFNTVSDSNAAPGKINKEYVCVNTGFYVGIGEYPFQAASTYLTSNDNGEIYHYIAFY